MEHQLNEWDEESWIQKRIEEEKSSKGKVTLDRVAEFLYVAAMRSGRRERLGLRCDTEYWKEKAQILLNCKD